MNIKNFEFKARVESLEPFEQILRELHADFKGVDHQIDTYFNVPKGRLKLREGNIENALISYERENIADAKLSKVILYKYEPNVALKEILTAQLGIFTIVDKTRKIYFIENVKFHLDHIRELGFFIEVEAIDNEDKYSIEELKQQCNSYLEIFKTGKYELIDKSYSDLILALVK